MFCFPCSGNIREVVRKFFQDTCIQICIKSKSEYSKGQIMQTVKLSFFLILFFSAISFGNIDSFFDLGLGSYDQIDISQSDSNLIDNELYPPFQYQGLLIEQGIPVYGIYDLEFTLYDTPNDVNLIALPVFIDDVNVIDGHYSVELDFGNNIFNGQTRWMEIWHRLADTNDLFVFSGKREKLSPVPYAIYSYNGFNMSDNEISRNSLDAADGDPNNAVYVDKIGRVGIGTKTPSEILDVFGTVKMKGFKMATGASSGYFLMSDSEGNGIWNPLPDNSPGLTGSGTTNYFPKYTSSDTLGISPIFDNSGKIGIGTTNPSAKLEVQGGAIKATGGLIIETRTSDPPNPVTGQIWLRTDF